MKKKPVENKHFAAFFFVMFFIFFILFIWNSYTMNIIMTFICLILSMSFKTWQVIREVRE